MRAALISGLVGSCLAAAGCQPYDFDRIGDVSLGVPGASVFGYSEIGELMVVFSDMPELCDALYQHDPPQFADWWVVSVWTRSAVRVGEDLAVDGYAAVSVSDEVTETDTTDAWLRLKSLDDEHVSGTVYLELESSDRIRAKFDALPCNAPLFIGLEG